MRMRGAIALGWVAWLGGCGLVLDLQQQDPDAGPPGMDARVVMVDAGDPPPPECTTDEGCPDDGDACTTAERCADGRCVADTVACDDGIACTVDSCDPSQGCTHRADDAVCDETLPEGDCRVPRCDPSVGCALEPSDALCDDGFACTDDVCARDGVCLHEANDERCALSVASASVCDPTTGAAGSGCTEVDCVDNDDCALAPTACVLGGLCVSSVCRPQHAANDTVCDDGLFCTMASSCQSGICVGSMRRPCNDMNACTDDSCVEASDGAVCVHGSDPAMNGLPCDDGMPCTGPGTCNSGTCAPGASTCFANPSTCQVATCTTAGLCTIATPCLDENRICADGACAGCRPNFADCDGREGCECPLGLGRVCTAGACENAPPDASTSLPDASTSLPDAGDAAIRDAAPRDALPDGCLHRDPDGGFCAGGFEDCGNDGCCECDRSTHFCNREGPGFLGCVRNLDCPSACPEGQECCPCMGVCTANGICPCAV